MNTCSGYSVIMCCVLGPTRRVTAAADNAGGRSHDRPMSKPGRRTCKNAGGQGHKVGA